jgi:hypothetical protein
VTVTAQQAREAALALEDAAETPHFDRIAFRTSRRIFATLAGDGTDMNLMFDLDLQAFYCEQAPEAFSPVPGGWGRSGSTRCRLEAVDPATFRGALAAAHVRACLPPPSRAGKPRGR